MNFGKPPRGGRLVTEAQQTFSFSRRALFVGAAQGAIGAVLVGRMAWLTIAEHDKYAALAESNRARSTLIPPRRGWIIDRTGQPIAINRSDFRVDLIPDLLDDPKREIELLQNLLQLAPEDIERLQDNLPKAAGFQPVQVAEDLDYEHFAAVNLRLPDLPGVVPARGFSRSYPAGPAVAHLIGYVGSASAEDYKKDKNPLLITPGFKIGKQGLEKSFDHFLRGQPGAKPSEVTARGKLVRELPARAETPGNTLQLTIDAGLQDYIAERMGDQSGSAVVIDTQTGDILAMVSMPAYDPNSFSKGISHDEWNMLSANDHLPLVNKTLQGLYPAGSTVKPMNALALLEAGVSPDETVACSGALRVGNSFFHCWRHQGHGAISMHRAIEQSCDIYFYQMSRKVGTKVFADMLKRLGLGEKYPLPFGSQRYGTVPDPDWKLRKYHKEWTVSDTLNSSIGQGYTLVNPLQIAVAAARIASGKTLIPRVVHRHSDQPPQSMGVSAEHLAIIHSAMGDVVGPGGTANSARIQVPGVAMGGKTGSAQVRRISMADRAAGRAQALGTQGEWKLRDHGLFISFAPVETPRYAAGIILEHAGHGAAAAQIARDAYTYLFDKQRALDTLAKLQPSWGGDIDTRMAKEKADWAAQQAALAQPQGAPADEGDMGAQANAAQPPDSSVATAVAPPSEAPDNTQDTAAPANTAVPANEATPE
ncbi:penicillin-binding protein 2 [Sphingomonas sp. CGMCC 1.13654]|uniref:Penicillin-binding protein 2 n=1 Tax=Sphingomonas chungangi TaxID=2683589 RepID=A0A838LCQ4_9SPHN|nr:penicillin-binding protein 2 [Sphingomonas chungangi]MBA2936662.1 penicillin-binding protein 2 [Sphingomonas chungangi]MVW56047.1 penicillin-binding protein 2 [Sphingomonas chungangi]